MDFDSEHGVWQGGDLSWMDCFSFDKLCNNELVAMHYLVIAQQFDIIVLEDIGLLDNWEGHNWVHCFIR